MKNTYICSPTLKSQTTTLKIPGDKSLSHRAVILGALCENASTFTNFLCAEDCLNTARIFKQLQVPLSWDVQTETLSIQGVGLRGLKAPTQILDTGNSGTGIRLISGILSAQNFDASLTGDSSIQKRPMKRIITPLSQMGATITGQSLPNSDNIFPPLSITGKKELQSTTYTLPVASAQVKSAVLLASLYANGQTTVIEPEKCRDHTERLLEYFGAPITVDGTTIRCSSPDKLVNPSTTPITIPSDISSAAFFIVLGLIRPNTELTLHNIGLNPTRAAIIDMLQAMGGDITITPNTDNPLEPMGTLVVKTSSLTNCDIKPEWIPFLIDEIPILAIAALHAKGTFTLKNAEELRVKESDRIQTVVALIQAMGCTITETPDGFILPGEQTIQPFTADSHGDHRIAMSGIIGSLGSGVKAEVKNTDCINTSFPTFFTLIQPFVDAS